MILNRHNLDAIAHTTSDAMEREGEAEWLAARGMDAKELIAYLRLTTPNALADGLTCFMLGFAAAEFVNQLDEAGV